MTNESVITEKGLTLLIITTIIISSLVTYLFMVGFGDEIIRYKLENKKENCSCYIQYPSLNKDINNINYYLFRNNSK